MIYYLIALIGIVSTIIFTLLIGLTGINNEDSFLTGMIWGCVLTLLTSLVI